MASESVYAVQLAPAIGELVDVPWSATPIPTPAVFTFVGPGALSSKTGPAFSTTIEFDVDSGGALLARKVSIFANTPAGVVTGAVLRRVPIGQLAAMAARLLAQGGDLRKGHSWSPVGLDDLNSPAVALRDDRQWLPPLSQGVDHTVADGNWVANLRALGPSHPHTSRSVAALYRVAEGQSEPPVKYIAKLTGLPASTVSHWVRLARDAGALPPSARKSRVSRDA